MPKDSAAVLTQHGVQCDPPEVAAIDIWNTVVRGQPLVDKREISPQQIQHTAVVTNQAADEKFRLLLKRLTKIFIEIWKCDGIGDNSIQVPQIEPLASEIPYQLRRARISQHPSRLLLKDR